MLENVPLILSGASFKHTVITEMRGADTSCVPHRFRFDNPRPFSNMLLLITHQCKLQQNPQDPGKQIDDTTRYPQYPN